MNSIIETQEQQLRNFLSTIPMCDSKNLTILINEYTPYSFIEICFNIASVELSIKTGLENEEGYLTESVILDILSHPEKYHIHYRLIEKFLREFQDGNYASEKDNEKIISALMTDLIYCEYDVFKLIITQDAENRNYDNEDEYDEEVENHFLHLEYLLSRLRLLSYFDVITILKKYTKLSDDEIDEINEFLSYDDY